MREKCFLVEGAKNVSELLNSTYKIEVLLGTKSYLEAISLPSALRVEEVKSDVLSQLGTFKTNDTVLAVARMQEFGLNHLDNNEKIFVLDDISDPGNMGTIVRTLDWFGYDQVILSPSCADFHHPKVIHSSMGSFTRVRAITCELSSFYPAYESPIIVADMQGTALMDFTFPEACAIVMGSESHGPGSATKKHASHRVTIPSFGSAESLNVGVAAGILLAQLRMA